MIIDPNRILKDSVPAPDEHTLKSLVNQTYSEIGTLRLLLKHNKEVTQFPYFNGFLRDSLITNSDILLSISKLSATFLNSNQKKTYWRLTFGSSLGKELREKIIKLASERLSLKSSSDSLFYLIRYSLQFSSYTRTQDHIARLTNLVNLHEGFISPLFVCSVLLFFESERLIASPRLWSGVVAFIMFSMWIRYHYFRELRVKQILRYFFLWHSIGNESK